MFAKLLICVDLGQRIDLRLYIALSHAYISISACRPVQSDAFGQRSLVLEKSNKQPVEAS